MPFDIYDYIAIFIIACIIGLPILVLWYRATWDEFN